MEPRADRQLPPSSLPPSQPWLNHSASALRANSRVLNSPLDDSSTLARRTTSLRQLHANSRQQRNPRHNNSIASRSSLLSQPVIVSTYSPEPQESSSASQRRGSNMDSNRPPAQLPSVQDFGIEGILKAINPDIQETLDAIAEICGRSKLSLANEYGSHRPPLGEIQARPIDHGLLTVEEASSSNERLVDESVLVVGDDISTVDGRDHYHLPHGLFSSLHRNPGLLDNQNDLPRWGERTAQQTAEPAPSILTTGLGHIHHLEPTLSSRAGHRKVKLPYLPWTLQDKTVGLNDQHITKCAMSSQPVISEVLLDAQADKTSPASTPDQEVQSSDYSKEGTSVVSELQVFIRWLGNISHPTAKQNDTTALNLATAQTKLQELLERQGTS
ncbi:hypothetical protein FQN57_000633 [Myotisia sp. PD_48]|nr:hypothetical protein FQN57_000633 [Myotisia sp. PD_48]